MSIWDKLASMDRRWVYFFFVVVTVVPTLFPMSLPINITPYHKTIYDFVEGLKPGDIVVMAVEYSASTMGELHPPFVAITKHLIKKDLKAIFVGNTAESPMFAEKLVKMYLDAGKEYGRDVVDLGFIPGEEQAITAMAESFSKTVAKDYRGIPIEDLPLMQEIDSAKDAAFIIQDSAGGLGPLGWIRQVHVPYKTPVATIVSQVMMPSALPYYQAGQLIGVGSGLRFAAEYETLLDDPGPGMAGMGAESFAHLYFMLLIILGNVGWIVARRQKAAQGGRNA